HDDAVAVAAARLQMIGNLREQIAVRIEHAAGQGKARAANGEQHFARRLDYFRAVPSMHPTHASPQIFRAHQAEVAADVKHRAAFEGYSRTLQQRVPALQPCAGRAFGRLIEPGELLIEEVAALPA